MRFIILYVYVFFFQAEDGIRDAQESRGLGDVYKRQVQSTHAFVSPEELANPPTVQEGSDMETELALRVFGCELIQQGCVLLKLPQVAALSGQILFHRFYYKVSFQRFDVEISSMAALFLASKREECAPFRKVKDFVNVWDHMRKLREGKSGKDLAPLNPWSDDFREVKDRMVSAERMMLKKLGFVLFVEHPQKFIIMYLQQLQLWNLSQAAWNYCNDSFRSTLCCRYDAEVIACGALLLACKSEGVTLPSKPCVWSFFGANSADVQVVADEISSLYCRPKSANVEGLYVKRPTRRELKEKAAKEKKAKDDALAVVKAAADEKARKEKEEEDEKIRKEKGSPPEEKRRDGSDSDSDGGRRSRDRRRDSSRSPRRRSRSRCLLYTSDAADEEDSVDLGGRRILQKKKKTRHSMIGRENDYKQK
eukprot:TRINITY_DN17518_c0_g2_i1.p1 TRINITY_DN17518_c0_g2~~TRINITY_DN17518_c0_g2_i1.p1  ORF type:complete len:422 (-),score=116.30 TRINITY_DN17518_c0_g2_i1:46-1311(-)